MNNRLKLFVVLLGGRPFGATIEQHNVFWGVAHELEDLYGAIKRSWLAAPKVHIDAYMCIEQVNDYDVVICEKNEVTNLVGIETEKNLFFVNVGFYKKDVMGEYHGGGLIIASDKEEVKTIFINDIKLDHIEDISIHIDDCHLLSTDIDVEIPNNSESNQKEFTVCLKKVRSGSDVYPKVVVGYHKIP